MKKAPKKPHPTQPKQTRAPAVPAQHLVTVNFRPHNSQVAPMDAICRDRNIRRTDLLRELLDYAIAEHAAKSA